MTIPFAVISRSEEPRPASTARLQRTSGEARIGFKNADGATRLDCLFQSGAAKARLPNVPAGSPPQAVLINTAGGLTGGDRMAYAVEVGAGARAVATTQACEKIYRSVSGEAELSTTLSIGAGARLDWIPQETILFDGARLVRRLDAEIAPGATLLAVEATIFGRAARGETVQSGLFRDSWRVRRGGRLLFADALRFDWATAGLLNRPATLAGAGAMATILMVADEPERRLAGLRRILGASGGATAWNGKLLARMVSEGGAALRRVLVPAIVELLDDGAALPKIWQL
jgi:urease accessory protein